MFSVRRKTCDQCCFTEGTIYDATDVRGNPTTVTLCPDCLPALRKELFLIGPQCGILTLTRPKDADWPDIMDLILGKR